MDRIFHPYSDKNINLKEDATNVQPNSSNTLNPSENQQKKKGGKLFNPFEYK